MPPAPTPACAPPTAGAPGSYSCVRHRLRQPSGGGERRCGSGGHAHGDEHGRACRPHHLVRLLLRLSSSCSSLRGSSAHSCCPGALAAASLAHPPPPPCCLQQHQPKLPRLFGVQLPRRLAQLPHHHHVCGLFWALRGACCGTAHCPLPAERELPSLRMAGQPPDTSPLLSPLQNLCEAAKWPAESCADNCECPSNFNRCASDGRCLVRHAEVAAEGSLTAWRTRAGLQAGWRRSCRTPPAASLPPPLEPCLQGTPGAPTIEAVDYDTTTWKVFVDVRPPTSDGGEGAPWGLLSPLQPATGCPLPFRWLAPPAQRSPAAPPTLPCLPSQPSTSTSCRDRTLLAPSCSMQRASAPRRPAVW